MGGTVWERDFRCEGFDVSLCSRLSAPREASTKNSRFSHLLTNMRVCAMNGYVYIVRIYIYDARCPRHVSIVGNTKSRENSPLLGLKENTECICNWCICKCLLLRFT